MTNFKSDLSTLPMLPGWITVASAAKRLKCSTTAVYWRINNGSFKNVYRLGEPDAERFVVVLDEREVAEFQAMVRDVASKRVPASQEVAVFKYRNALRDWNKRVKDWAKFEPGLSGQINTSGQPAVILRDAYLRAHPEDPRPVKPAK